MKVVQLPSSSDDELGMSFRQESLGRIRREVEALGKCKMPELVKLASIPPTDAAIAGTDYVIYSEEFLPGADLCALIQNARKKPPAIAESELRLLMLALLRGIKELWGHGYIHRDIMRIPVKSATDSGIIPAGYSERSDAGFSLYMRVADWSQDFRVILA